ncbi:MAG: hypothetical protein VSS75_010575 [Candidatus Parabeggiatoa sp.]|nr:hypothetical protein [Candidatus Parabeggiatoa sp.]
MKTITLHIGLPKTGSTSLQAFCSKNQAQLTQLGVYYPTEGRYFHQMAQHVWARALKGPHYRFWWTDPADMEFSLPACHQELMAHIEASNCPNILLSAEELWHNNVPETLGTLFEGFPYQVRILAYLRRQDSLLLSAYNQCIKTADLRLPDRHHIGTFDEFVHIELGDAESLFNFYPLLSQFARVFGQENVMVRVFEPSQLVGGDLIQDCLKVLDIAQSEAFEIPEPMNKSLPQELIDIMRLFNSQAKLARNEHLRFNYLLRDMPKFMALEDYQPMSPELRWQILEHYREDNARVAREFLGREDGQLFYPEISDREASWTAFPRLSTATVARTVVQMWAQEQERNQFFRATLANLEAEYAQLGAQGGQA